MGRIPLCRFDDWRPDDFDGGNVPASQRVIVQDQLLEVPVRGWHEGHKQVVGQHTGRLGEAHPLGVAPLLAASVSSCGSCRAGFIFVQH